MIKNILLGYSGARGAQVALSQALELARPAKARLHVTMIEAMASRDSQVALLPDPEVAGLRLPDTGGEAAEPELPPDGDAALEELAETCRREDVFCTFNHHYGEAGVRLVQLSRLADLLVVGRRDDPAISSRQPPGRTARYLATHPATPTLFTDREHLPVKSATLYYVPRQAGGRALARAGEVANLLNISLNVVCLPYEGIDAAAAEEEARFALRAYHLDGEWERASATLAEALANTTLSWNDPLVVVPAPPRGLLLSNHETTRLALALTNTNVLLVP